MWSMKSVLESRGEAGKKPVQAENSVSINRVAVISVSWLDS